jgi:hypothetical protein
MMEKQSVKNSPLNNTLRPKKGKLKFVCVDADILYDPSLSNYEVMVWIALKSHTAGDDNTCFPSVKRIAKLARCGTTKANQAINGLIEKGYLRKLRVGGKLNGTSNRYAVFDHPINKSMSNDHLLKNTSVSNNSELNGGNREAMTPTSLHGDEVNAVRSQSSTNQATPPNHNKEESTSSEVDSPLKPPVISEIKKSLPSWSSI